MSRTSALPLTLVPEFVASRGDLELVTPVCAPGIGDVILTPDSPKLIHGVEIHAVAVWPDDRGFFLEILRTGEGLVQSFPARGTQVSAAVSYPGTIKAFHYHLDQTDCWTPVSGMFQFALVDLRRDSPTFGQRNTLYCGSLRPWQVLIPPGIGHGYKVLGSDPALLVYATDHFYNPKDEGRIPHNHAAINYNWETQHK